MTPTTFNPKCGVGDCTEPAVTVWNGSDWRCVEHDAQEHEAAVRAGNAEQRRERVEEQFYVGLVLHAYKKNGKTVTDDELHYYRAQAKRYAAHLVEEP